MDNELGKIDIIRISKGSRTTRHQKPDGSYERVLFNEFTDPADVTFESGVFLLLKVKAKWLKADRRAPALSQLRMVLQRRFIRRNLRRPPGRVRRLSCRAFRQAGNPSQALAPRRFEFAEISHPKSGIGLEPGFCPSFGAVQTSQDIVQSSFFAALPSILKKLPYFEYYS
jgi:hypothetical protein